MSLSPGDRLGSYQVTALIGMGGMGEVYRAHDEALGRDVALKILPSAFASDPERLARFEREARLLAALNHPHVAAIYGIAQADGVRALVLELVEGPTLVERIRVGALPEEEAISIAGQIAEALEAAHEKGIVHRDLKPANIKLTLDGRVKVLDFGLGRALDSPIATDSMQSPTFTTLGTRVGVILGTAAYMSPEQARGGAVDKRTDIWAFGCVLYEMLTGRTAFAGETVSDTIAAIIGREPDWSALPDTAPATVRRLLGRCLVKDAKQRVRDIGDVRIELQEALAPTTEKTQGMRRERRSWSIGRWVPVIVSVVIASALAVRLWQIEGGKGQPPPLMIRATIVLPANHALDTLEEAAPLALSPDGRRLVYAARVAGRPQLYLRDLDAFDAQPLPGSEGARYPFFSPDGQWVAFFAGAKLKRLSIHGGSPLTVCDAPVIGRGGTWGSDGTIVFDPGDSGLLRVAVQGGTPEPVTSRDAVMDRRNLSWPQFLPDGRALLATAGLGEDAELLILPFETRTWRRLGRGFQAQYVRSGHLVFHAPAVREGEIHAAEFDLATLAVRGTPMSVLDGVFRSENGGGAYFAVSGIGALVFARGSYARTLVRVDRHGRRTPLLEDRRGFRIPRISPDGRSVAITIDPRPSQVWVYDLVRRSGIPLSTDGHSLGAIWSAQGDRVTYTSTGADLPRQSGDIYSRSADGSSAARRLLTRSRAQYPGVLLRDGSLIFIDDHPTNRADLWMMPLGAEPRPLVSTRAHEFAPRLSPDERWLAYSSDESGRFEVYARPFPNVDAGRWPVSTGGGMFPVWSPTGRELFYMNGTTMMVVPIETKGGRLAAGTPEVLFTGPFETGSPQFDLSPDGTYFVMVEADPDARPTQIHLVTNWVDELKRITAAPQ